MEINKQLFEDVLSGKLKGTFVLRNGVRINTSDLKRNVSINDDTDAYPYIIMHYDSYTRYGSVYTRTESDYDIVDFIPDTDMKENELTIEIPDNKVVDWGESKKQNKIILKDKSLTYEDVCKKLFQPNGCYYICGNGEIVNSFATDRFSSEANNATSKHQLECILAKNKLANVAKYLNDGWKPSKTDLGHFDAWVIYVTPNKDYMGYVKIVDCAHNSNVLFKSSELAQRAIEILGKKTIKLALEPLY